MKKKDDVTILMDEFDVSRETLEKLKIYEGLLARWQAAINLVSRETLDHFWARHILDSLQIKPYVTGQKLLDVGSGGGFPGMVLAICGVPNVTCLDSSGKKIIFLEEVARETDTAMEFLNMRIEDLEDDSFGAVSARGFSRLFRLLSIVLKNTASGFGVFLKGKKVNLEITEAQEFFDFEYKLHGSKTNPSGCIIVVNNVLERHK